jgi:thioredoxin 1
MSQVHHATDSDFDAQILQAEQPVLVDFSATWCGPCKKLEPIVQEIAGDFDGRLKVVKVDVDQARTSAARFGVLSVPTVLLFKGGEVKDQVIGVTSKASLSEKIERIL